MTNLCSLADVKAWLATGTDAFPTRDDALLMHLISDTSDFIEKWLARPVGLANWQEIRDGTGGERANAMELAMTPVTNILLLAIDGIAIQPLPRAVQFPTSPPPAQNVGIISPGGWAQGYTFTSTEIAVWGWRFSRGKQNVVIQYTAGYNPIPGGIQRACIEMVCRKYRERPRIGVRTISIGGIETVTYETTIFGARDVSDIETALWQYRQEVMLTRPILLPTPAPALVLEDVSAVIQLEDATTPIVAEGSAGSAAPGTSGGGAGSFIIGQSQIGGPDVLGS